MKDVTPLLTHWGYVFLTLTTDVKSASCYDYEHSVNKIAKLNMENVPGNEHEQNIKAAFSYVYELSIKT